jgi:hypothetical protein
MRFLANENFPAAAVAALRAAGHDVAMPEADEVGERLAALISARDDWAGCFSVVEPGRVRMRPLG